MKHANAEERSRLIAGLHDLADFLDENAEVPAPRWAEVFIFPLSTTDDEMKGEIDVIAALIGSSVDDRTTDGLHYTTTRNFGPVQYRAVAISSRSPIGSGHDADDSEEA
jgi:hypothetical protein